MGRLCNVSNSCVGFISLLLETGIAVGLENFVFINRGKGYFDMTISLQKADERVQFVDYYVERRNGLLNDGHFLEKFAEKNKNSHVYLLIYKKTQFYKTKKKMKKNRMGKWTARLVDESDFVKNSKESSKKSVRAGIVAMDRPLRYVNAEWFKKMDAKYKDNIKEKAAHEKIWKKNKDKPVIIC